MVNDSNFERPGRPARPADLSALVIHVDTATSTNDVARTLLATAAIDTPTLTTIHARRQVSGRGRLGRTWTSLPDRSLTASTIVRLPPTPGIARALPWVLLAQALATRAALDARLTPLGHATGVTWPNDVVVDGSRKIAGLLGEVVRADTTGCDLVVGTGVNVSMTPAERPTPRATALSLEGDRQARRSPASVIRSLLTAQLEGLADRLDALVGAGGDASRSGLLEEFRLHCRTIGNPVVVRDALDPGPPDPSRPGHRAALARTGLARDVLPDGSLLVETPDGHLHTVRTGDVEMLLGPPT